MEQRGGWGLGWVRGGAWLERVMPRLSKEQGLERMSGTISIASEAEARKTKGLGRQSRGHGVVKGWGQVWVCGNRDPIWVESEAESRARP